MAKAPTGDDTLQEGDAVNILEELLDARNHSFRLGLKLKLPVHGVEAIFTKYSDPRDRVLQIIIAFLRRAEPRPTWRVIVGALRSNAVNLPALAMRVEAAHFPDLAAARDVAPDTDHSQESKKAELTNAEETTIVNRTRQRKTQAKDRAQPQQGQTEEQLRSSENTVTDLSQKKPIQGSKWRWIIVLIAAFVFFGFFILFFILPDTQQQLRQKEEQQRSSESTVAAFQKQRDSHPQGTKTQPGLLATAVPHSIPAKPRKLTVQCRQKKRARHSPVRGSAATDGRFVYITPAGSTSIYQYECSTEKWTELPSCPCNSSGLAIIDSELTTVGGLVRADRYYTNRLFTLRQGKWVEVYPPMNTARYGPAVVSTSDGDYHIVIGGYGNHVPTAAVELFRVKSREWYKLTDLPQPLHRPSATIFGDTLYVTGSYGNGYSCSLQSLPSNDTSPLTWKPLPPLRVKESTAATLSGQLVTIGGEQGGWPVNSIHQLVEGQWVEIGYMTTGRTRCLAVSLSPDRILIVGGVFEDSVEECVAF